MENLTQINKSAVEPTPPEQLENKIEQKDSVGTQEPFLSKEELSNAEVVQAAIHEQRLVTSETARLDAMSKVREKLGMPTLINADSIPLSDIGKFILEKKQRGENLTMLEAINSGKIVRSEYWNSCQSLDTRMFKEDYSDTIKDLVTKEAVVLTWREISGKWSIVENETSIYDL